MRITKLLFTSLFISFSLVLSFSVEAVDVSKKAYEKAVTTGKKIRIKGMSFGDGKSLDALIYSPPSSNPSPAIVALHGAGGIFPYQLWWANELAKKGFTVIFVDHYCTRGHLCEHATDDSDSARGDIMRDWQRVSPKQRAVDAVAAFQWLIKQKHIKKDTSFFPIAFICQFRACFQWLIKQKHIKKDKIGLIGWSWGGTTALFVQKVARRFSLPNGGFKASIAFYPNLKYVLDKPQWSRTGPIEQPVLILYGKEDILESPEAYKSLKASGFPAPIRVIGFEGAYRKFDELGEYREKFHPAIGKFPKEFHKKSFERSVLEVANFFKKYLQ